MHQCINCSKKCNCYVTRLSVCSNQCKTKINPKYKTIVKVCNKK